MNRILHIAFLVLVVFFTIGCAENDPYKGYGDKKVEETLTFPRLANWMNNPAVSADQIQQLGKYDLVVLDMENFDKHPNLKVDLQNINPDIRVLAYFNPNELFPNMGDTRPIQQGLYDRVNRDFPGWFLKDPSGDRLINWSPMEMMNLTSWSPTIEGWQWNTFSITYLYEHFFSRHPEIDGYAVDNVWDDGSWAVEGNIDANNDGKKDDPIALDQAWQAGIAQMLARLRELAPDKIIVGNEPNPFYRNVLNGKAFEEFGTTPARGGWIGDMMNYLYYNNDADSILTFTCDETDKQCVRFSLGTAMLGNGYFAVDGGPSAHDVIYWYDDLFSRSLGKAKGPATPPFEILFHENFEDSNIDELGKAEIVDELKGKALQIFTGSKVQLPLDVQAEGEYRIFFAYRMANADASSKLAVKIAAKENSYTRWTSGMPVSELFSLKSGDGLEISFSGAGSVVIDEVLVFSAADGLWTREFEGGFAAVNPTDNDLQATIAGQQYTVKSKDAIIAYYE
jgi:hypothetical protein